MATGSIVLPTNGLNQEHRCKEHKSPRYYKLTWGHLTIAIKDAKYILNTALPYLFYGAFSSIPILSLSDALNCPYNDLYWDETQGVYFDRSLDVLVDVGVTTNCTIPCGLPHLAIPLGDQVPSIESYRMSGLEFYTKDGDIIRDRKTVFNRVHQAQVELKILAEAETGHPVVKSIEYVRAYCVLFLERLVTGSSLALSSKAG
jgi:hypothetical protein